MNELLADISDPLIRAGVAAAVERTLLPAMARPAYAGHFTVTADGQHFGSDTTWPGLDSWEMAGSYLLLGHSQVVLDYFAFVRASQRDDGNIPFAIFPGEQPPPAPESYLRGINYPDDVYAFAPRGAGEPRRWIGLFEHWQMRVNPLSVLAPICHVLTAGEIAGDEMSIAWLRDGNFASAEAAGRYVLSRKSANGLISGAGFYIECPPRDQWDGVTQCYAVYAMRELARMGALLGDADRARTWAAETDLLARTFRETFWVGDHFAEYVHPVHGVVDLHGLSDINFAAIALGLATPEQEAALWPRLASEERFWHGGMPTQLVSNPLAYRDWERPEPLPFVHVNGDFYDVAAMGRVWLLDALACRRMHDWERLRAATRLVCATGERHGWQWHERYHAQCDGMVKPAGPAGYCEYAAVLVRVVLGCPEAFCSQI